MNFCPEFVAGSPSFSLASKKRCTTDQALEFFDELPAVAAQEITGRWRGSELATGHPLDGLLAASGWYGKQFDGPDSYWVVTQIGDIREYFKRVR